MTYLLFDMENNLCYSFQGKEISRRTLFLLVYYVNFCVFVDYLQENQLDFKQISEEERSFCRRVDILVTSSAKVLLHLMHYVRRVSKGNNTT